MMKTYKSPVTQKKKPEVKPSLRSSKNESTLGANLGQVKLEQVMVTPARRNNKIPNTLFKIGQKDYQSGYKPPVMKFGGKTPKEQPKKNLNRNLSFKELGNLAMRKGSEAIFSKRKNPVSRTNLLTPRQNA